MQSITHRSDLKAAGACVFLGIVVAAVLARNSPYFLPNFLSFWGPQMAVLVVSLICRPHPVVLAGTACALAGYLALFGSWVLTRSAPDSMAWLGYISSMPGAAIGALLAAILFRKQATQRPVLAGCLAAATVCSGIAVNQVFICSTVMYCLGP